MSRRTRAKHRGLKQQKKKSKASKETKTDGRGLWSTLGNKNNDKRELWKLDQFKKRAEAKKAAREAAEGEATGSPTSKKQADTAFYQSLKMEMRGTVSKYIDFSVPLCHETKKKMKEKERKHQEELFKTLRSIMAVHHIDTMKEKMTKEERWANIKKFTTKVISRWRVHKKDQAEFMKRQEVQRKIQEERRKKQKELEFNRAMREYKKQMEEELKKEEVRLKELHKKKERQKHLSRLEERQYRMAEKEAELHMLEYRKQLEEIDRKEHEKERRIRQKADMQRREVQRLAREAEKESKEIAEKLEEERRKKAKQKEANAALKLSRELREKEKERERELEAIEEEKRRKAEEVRARKDEAKAREREELERAHRERSEQLHEIKGYHTAVKAGDVNDVQRVLGIGLADKTSEEEKREFINRKDKQGNTALHHAMITNSMSILRHLLEIGMDPDAQDKNGDTALHLACRKSYKNIVYMLIAAGADHTIKNYEGKICHETASTKAFVLEMKAWVTRCVEKSNTPPVLNIPVGDKFFEFDKPFSFSFPSDTFVDADGDELEYLCKGLPKGVSFKVEEMVVSGTIFSSITLNKKEREAAGDSAVEADPTESEMTPKHYEITLQASDGYVVSSTTFKLSMKAGDDAGAEKKAE